MSLSSTALRAPSLLLRALSLLLLVLSAGTVAAATRVELVIDEATPNRTVAWPVTTGIPFPAGGLTAAEHCRLVDDMGEERPMQSKVAATWDAARTSIRWLTIDFIAHPQRKYALEFGPEVLRKEIPPMDAYAEEDRCGIHNGFFSAYFRAKGRSALSQITIDFNNDGKLSPDEYITEESIGGDHRYVDQHDRVATSARDDTGRTLVMETNGAVRTCIRVDGWYTGPDGSRIVDYRTRYHFFAGLTVVKVIDEFRIVGSTRNRQFKDIALPLALTLAGDKRTIATAEGTFGKPPTYETSSLQQTYRHYGNSECKAMIVEAAEGAERIAHNAERVGPWMQVSDGRVVVTGSLRHFSQQFPKQWEYKDDHLTLHLWSPRVPPLDFGEKGLMDFFGPAGKKYLFDWSSGGGSTPITDYFYHAGKHALKRDGGDGLGINKHHEIWYHFGRASEAGAGREYGALADAQPLCLATGAWNVGTGVFGPLAARTNDSPYEAIVDRVFDLERKAQDDFGDYGWFLFGAGPHYSYQWDKETKKHYADPRRFEYHTYQRETQLWWTYFRSGERKFYDWCLPSENHWTDIAVAHTPTMYSTEWRGGKKGDARVHYPAGDWSIDSPMHYVRHHDTGEAWLRSASQFWGTYHRTLETTTLAYYLTGDERYNDIVGFWKDYWGALAGVRSDSTDAKPWHMDQMWWVPTKAGEPSKSWAEMVRDYAPFQSGSRHQQTLFFNLSTMYEHTWDPTVKQVLDEYAAAFIKPENPNGVWQCQDHQSPANADSPMLAHYWAPALWKYARASGDPRMPGVLKKYFTACIDADPYGGAVGIYSNNQIAWGWHFTKDRRFLTAAQHELEVLRPNAAPLEKPEDLGHRIYNPHGAITSMAGTPRLIGALEEAKRMGIAVPQTPPLEPQRNLFAIACNASSKPGLFNSGTPVRGMLWGWDPEVDIVAADGTARVMKTVFPVRSHRQPFDRDLPGFVAYYTEFTFEAGTKDAWVYVAPKLETGVVEFNAGDDVWCWAGDPVKIEPNRPWHWRRTGELKELSIESAQPGMLRVAYVGRELPCGVEKNRMLVDLRDLPNDAELTIDTSGGMARWARLVDLPDAACWLTPDIATAMNGGPLPPTPKKLIEARRKPKLEVDGAFTAGRFGKGLYVGGGNEFAIPDEVTAADGTKRRISDQRQGSLDFWIRRLTDERLQQVPQTMVLNAGSIYVTMPKHMPLDEWAHVAVDWFPLLDDPEQVTCAIYVNGVDHGNYRSVYWSGYGDRPPSFTAKQKWLGKFKIAAPPGTAFIVDDLRLSSAPRYVDVKTPFGKSQTFNPKSFDVPTKPAAFDPTMLWLAPFDRSVDGKNIGNLDLQGTTGALKIETIRLEGELPQRK